LLEYVNPTILSKSLHGKNGYAEVLKNLDRYRFENNRLKLSKKKKKKCRERLN